MNRLLAKTYPDAECELDFTTPLELSVATILSAQCTDKRVNQVTPTLNARYPSAADYAAADRGELEELVRSTGFATYDTGLAAADQHGFTPGDQISFRLATPDGNPLRDVTVTVPAAGTMTNLLIALNNNLPMQKLLWQI